MKKILTFALVLLVISSCQKTEKLTKNVSPVDSLITQWEQSWNTKDSIATLNLFETSAMIVDDNIVAMNAEEINRLFIRTNINVINNIKQEKLYEWNTQDRAGYFGKWELDVVVNDSIVAHPTGVITLNWLKNNLGQWKITNAQIHSFKPQ